LSTSLLILFALIGPLVLQATPTASVRDRLATWEQRAAQGRPDASELVAIAASVVTEAQQSRNPEVAIEACSSTVQAPAAACTADLWTIARDTRTAFRLRAAAASVLVDQSVDGAAAYLLKLASAASSEELASAAPVLLVLPAKQSIPLLKRLLSTDSPTAHVAGCSALGRIDTGESRTALADYLATAPRGTRPYYVCTLSAARLGDPIALRMTSGIVNYLAHADLVEAAELLGQSAPDRQASLLMLVTRQGSPLAQLLAANALVPLRPDLATDVMIHAFESDRPDLRAAALEVHRTLSIDATQQVRGFLLDEDPLVRLRAAETILDRAIKLGQHTAPPRRGKLSG
jgi:hypothetical protein